MLLADKNSNPSNYALVILSEGAVWQGYQTREDGEADGFGHRKKANVGEDLSDEIRKATDQETIG
jgi:ATP-dependent phosphofructokinase / diphosphate-dependent phosphofructokinase